MRAMFKLGNEGYVQAKKWGLCSSWEMKDMFKLGKEGYVRAGKWGLCEGYVQAGRAMFKLGS